MRGTVVISGASTGIGRATALHLAELGFAVLAGVRKEADGEALRAAGAVEPVILDVTDQGAIDAVRERIGEQPLAGLVNNAGVATAGPLEFVPVEEWRRQFEVNLFGHVAMTQALLPALRRAKGRIVNTGSIGGRTALPFVGPYSASKFAMHGMTDSLRGELRHFGIHVALVEPGSIATEIWRKGEETAQALASELPAEAGQLYGRQIAGVTKATSRTAGMAIPPERAAKVIAHALTARRPRARYLVGPDARVQNALGRLPAAVSDRVLKLAMGL